MILTCSLQSGSNGNCIYVQTDDLRLLIDAGISGKQAYTRLACRDIDIHSINALLITHDHADHISGAGVFHRKFRMPLFMTQGTWKAGKNKLGAVAQDALTLFSAGQTLTFGSTTVESVPTAHDGAEGVAFVISQGRKRLGIFTDLGHCFCGLADHIAGLDALYIESNYDPDMLQNGPYPYWLQKRIQGSGGHLSNGQAAQLVADHAHKLQWLALAHLSEHNNHPDLAYKTMRAAVGPDLPITLASRFHVSPILTLDE